MQGYDELDNLERPLVGGEDEEDYGDRPQGGTYRPPSSGGAEEGGGPGRPASFTVGLPSQTDEIQEISALSKDASEILWEMVAMGERGESMLEMRSRAEMLQAQLRGLINDYAGGDEKIFAGAFEAYEMISRCLDDQKVPENAVAEAAVEAPQQEVPAAAAAAAVEERTPVAVEPAQEQSRPVAVPPPAPAMPAVATANASAGADLISFD